MESVGLADGTRTSVSSVEPSVPATIQATAGTVRHSKKHPAKMSTFRDTSVPVTCGECGNRVLVPQARPGLLLKCPKCGTVLRAPSPAKTIHKPAATEAVPLGSAPTATMAPSTDIGAEIDALLLSDLPTESPSKIVPRIVTKNLPRAEAAVAHDSADGSAACRDAASRSRCLRCAPGCRAAGLRRIQTVRRTRPASPSAAAPIDSLRRAASCAERCSRRA